ncbi:MAG: hypothetical protein ACF788_09370 [Novipirellula sp. JB048]
MTNPFQPPIELPSERGVFGDHATLITRRFLYRKIRHDRPFPATLVYSGWWFRQKVEINDSVMWWKVSWIHLSSDIAFTVPREILAHRVQGDADQRVEERVPREQETADVGAADENAISPSQPIRGRINIQFTRGLRIRRFRVWFDRQLVYDEIN